MLTTTYLRRQVHDARAFLADLDAMLEESRTIEPLALARLAIDMQGVLETLEHIADRLDEATAPTGDPEGGQQP